MLAQLRAAAVALFIALAFTLGTPGLDYLDGGSLQDPDEREALRQSAGPLVGGLALALVDANRDLRMPLVRRLEWVQRPARVSQNWSLYRDGPGRVRRMEVYIDGVLRHRSADDDHDWLAPQLRSRRVRPVVEATAMQYASQNWEGLTRIIVQFARRDFPGCAEVRLLFTEGRFPGRKLDPKFSITAAAPSWVPERAWHPDWKREGAE